MKQEKEGGLKIFMRASEKYTRANSSPEEIFTTFSCAVPYRHEQQEGSLHFRRARVIGFERQRWQRSYLL